MKRASIACLCVLLAGCATSYQPQSFSGGFTETQLDKNVFRVSFAGNGFTSRDRVEDFTLLRCAQLTLSQGFTHFVVLGSQDRTTHQLMTTPTQSYTSASANAYGNSVYGTARTTTYGGDSFVVAKPGASNTIYMLNGQAPNGMFTYDAKFLRDSLSAKYGVNAGQ